MHFACREEKRVETRRTTSRVYLFVHRRHPPHVVASNVGADVRTADAAQSISCAHYLELQLIFRTLK